MAVEVHRESSRLRKKAVTANKALGLACSYIAIKMPHLCPAKATIFKSPYPESLPCFTKDCVGRESAPECWGILFTKLAEAEK